MTLTLHTVCGNRSGKKYGAMEVIDTMEVDGLVPSYAAP